MPEESFRCRRCGANRFVSVSLNGGLTRVPQCVPCGAIHPDYYGLGWQSANHDRGWMKRVSHRAEGRAPEAEHDAHGLTPEQAAALSFILEKAARLGRTATLDPGQFVKRERDADGDYERLDQWQRARLAAIGRVLPPGEQERSDG